MNTKNYSFGYTICKRLVMGRYFPSTSCWRKYPAWDLVIAELTGRREAVKHRIKIGKANSGDFLLGADLTKAIKFAEDQIHPPRNLTEMGRQALPTGDR